MKFVLGLLLGIGSCLVLAGCHSEPEATTPSLPQDRLIQSFQTELLDMALNAVSAIPVDPHIKDRSRAQEDVVTACLQLDQPQRALRYIKRILNWRQGTGYADLALYCVQHGVMEVEPLLDQAHQVAQTEEDWRKDRILVKIARTHAYLGQTQQADKLAADVVPAESGKVDSIKAMICDENSFAEQTKTLDDYIATGNFDLVKNSLQAYAQLFNQFYQDLERRPQIEEKIKASWDSIPISMRIDLLMQCAGFALDNADKDKAIDLINEADTMMEAATWPPRIEIPLRAKLATLRFRSGDPDKARTEIQDALALYDQQRERIVNIYKAGILRPLAEAYQAMGDTTAALTVYKQAIEAGVENPNSRPRAEDLSATCCSLAVQALEPDTALWDRIHEIYNGLGDPW